MGTAEAPGETGALQLPGPTPAGSGGRAEVLWGRIQRKKKKKPRLYKFSGWKHQFKPSIERFSAGGHLRREHRAEPGEPGGPAAIAVPLFGSRSLWKR